MDRWRASCEGVFHELEKIAASVPACPFGSFQHGCGRASVAQPDPLFMTIQSLDTKLFDAYDHCDLTTLGAMVSDDLEFYHDQTGLSWGRTVSRCH